MPDTPHLSVLRSRAEHAHLDAITWRVRTPRDTYDWVEGTRLDNPEPLTLAFLLADGTTRAYPAGTWVSASQIPPVSNDLQGHLYRLYFLGLLPMGYLTNAGRWLTEQPEHDMTDAEYSAAIKAYADAFERDKAIDNIARTVLDAPPRRFGDVWQSAPEGVSDAAWEAAQTKAEHIYVDVVEQIDFNRVLVQAEGRHLAVHENKATFLAAAQIGFTTVEKTCPDCIREVLLQTSTQPSWEQEPESPRYLRYDPWPEPLTGADD